DRPPARRRQPAPDLRRQSAGARGPALLAVRRGDLETLDPGPPPGTVEASLHSGDGRVRPLQPPRGPGRAPRPLRRRGGPRRLDGRRPAPPPRRHQPGEVAPPSPLGRRENFQNSRDSGPLPPYGASRRVSSAPERPGHP